jgi:hypothetical protein
MANKLQNEINVDRVDFNKECARIVSSFDIEMLNRDDGLQFAKNEICYRLNAYIFTSQNQEKEVSYLFDRPTFLDWLLRRRREARFIVKSKDALLDPPVWEDKTLRLYQYGTVGEYYGK